MAEFPDSSRSVIELALETCSYDESKARQLLTTFSSTKTTTAATAATTTVTTTGVTVYLLFCECSCPGLARYISMIYISDICPIFLSSKILDIVDILIFLRYLLYLSQNTIHN